MVQPPSGAIWPAFLACSARIGRDLTLVQGAGGNSSLKEGDRLWIKASGTWLAEAETHPVMVPVDLARMRAAITAGDLTEDRIGDMTLPGGPAGMRPSVETPFHALLPAPVVLHVHCLATLSHAIARDAEARLAARLDGLNWHWQPYVKPGVPLTYALRDAGAAGADIIVLGNHGLIATGPTPKAAEELLHEVRRRLSAPMTVAPLPAAPLPPVASTGYVAAEPAEVHALATDPALRALAADCAMAPDFVVFFGPGIPVLPPGPDLAARLAALADAPLPLNAVVLVEGQAALIRADAMRGTGDLLAGYAQMLRQFLGHGGGAIRHFSAEETAELLNWDAEKYRQSLNRRDGDA